MVDDEDAEEPDVYESEGRENLVEDDEMSAEEEGFLQGAEGMGQDAKCRKCGKILMEADNVIEKELKGEVLRFCSEECEQQYEEEHS
jgi:hypothetical protein